MDREVQPVVKFLCHQGMDHLWLGITDSDTPATYIRGQGQGTPGYHYHLGGQEELFQKRVDQICFNTTGNIHSIRNTLTTLPVHSA